MAPAVIAVIMYVIALENRGAFHSWPGVALYSLIMTTIVLVYLRALDKSEPWVGGGLGELKIARILKQLPRTFDVQRSIKLNQFGDIDFVVVGPSGVWNIEVKAWTGTIRYQDRALWRNGWQDVNLLPLMRHRARDIAKYLEGAKITGVSMASIVVFTPKKTVVSIDEALPYDEYVIPSDRLIATILRAGEEVLRRDQIKKISEVLSRAPRS